MTIFILVIIGAVVAFVVFVALALDRRNSRPTGTHRSAGGGFAGGGSGGAWSAGGMGGDGGGGSCGGGDGGGGSC